MKKTIIVLSGLLFIIIIIAIIVSHKINEKRAKKTLEHMQQKYTYTVNYLSDHLDDFEKMCEYDLKNYKNYKRSSTGDCYYVPEKNIEYNDERYVLFHDLGIYTGFRDGEIYPYKSCIVFSERAGDYVIELTYYKQGNGEILCSEEERIGEHFVLQYNYYPPIYN